METCSAHMDTIPEVFLLAHNKPPHCVISHEDLLKSLQSYLQLYITVAYFILTVIKWFSHKMPFDPVVGFLHFPPTVIVSIASELAFLLITQSYLIKNGQPSFLPAFLEQIDFWMLLFKYRLIISTVIVSAVSRVWADPALQGPTFNERATCWWSLIATVIHFHSLSPY